MFFIRNSLRMFPSPASGNLAADWYAVFLFELGTAVWMDTQLSVMRERVTVGVLDCLQVVPRR